MSKLASLSILLLSTTTVVLLRPVGARIDITAGEQSMPADLVAVTEDRAQFENGCDAISVFNVASGVAVDRGSTTISPGRLAGSHDFRVLVASASNGGYPIKGSRSMWPRDFEPFLYGYRQISGSAWRSADIVGDDFATMTALAVTRDDRFLLAARSGLSIDTTWIYQPRPPAELTKRALPSLTHSPSQVGTSLGHTRLPGLPFWVYPLSDGKTILAATDKAQLHTIDLDTMAETRPPISFPPVAGPGNEFYGSTIHKSYGTITADEHYVVTNGGTTPAAAVTDLIAGTSWSLPLPGLEHVAGIAINRGWNNAGLLAAHGSDRIAVYAFSPTEGNTLLAQIAVRGQKCSMSLASREPYGPVCALAWSTDGTKLIAATNEGPAEFVVIDVLDGGTRLATAHKLVACGDAWNFPNDIFTLNGFITPTATPTPPITDTPAPTTTPLPTDTPPASHTPTATHTPSPTPSRTPSPTLTATPRPAPLYMPLLLREECVPEARRSDVVLVMDASSSMLDPTATGGTKLDAASTAARVFLDQLHLEAGDQAAVVAFNADAWLVTPLTADRALLDAGLAGLTTAQFTRIDRGIAVAREELVGPRHDSDNTPVMVVLTDGRANPVPVEAAIDEARLAKAAGIQLFTIGLGTDLDAAALAQMASRPEWYYPAPTAEDLAAIYRAIAVTIPCPPAAFWGRR